MPVTALTVMIGGFNSIALFRMQRHLELGRLARLELLAQAVSILVTVAWARGTSVASRAMSSSGVSKSQSEPPRGRFIR